MNRIELQSAFDLAATLDSGQVFHWLPHGDGFLGTVGEFPAYAEQRDQRTILIDSPEPDAVARYLALDHSIDKIVGSFPKQDKPLQKAMKHSPGLRLLRQPYWECLATFITSSLKQVAHIRQISLHLREKFGTAVEAKDGTELFAYPSPEAIARAGETKLQGCKLGYRAAFLHRTAQAVCDGDIDLEAIAHLNDERALAALCQCHGVGKKIASCVLLFAYERHAAFPIDVWIERILRQLYFDNSTEVTSRELRDFAAAHFGEYGGYAQQFLFHFARTTGLKG